MGLLSWFKGQKPQPTKPNAAAAATTTNPKQVPGMNGAVEVPRAAANVTVFEFGSAAAAAATDNVTLAGYCPVSEELEPCRWELLPASPKSDAPQFRVVF